MSKPSPSFGIRVTGKFVKVYFRGLLHLLFRLDEYRGLQSWIEADGAGGSYYFVTLYLGDAEVTCDYDERWKWEELLRLFETTFA